MPRKPPASPGSPEPFFESGSLDELRRRAAECRACDLWARATQTVFGEGRKHAPLMLVGEQPGNEEDLAGRPFVGPAGKLLERALTEAGIERPAAYVTNVVKHFSWEPRGRWRIHKKPNGREIAACRPWLDREIALVQPRVLVCLGATAAQALLGSQFRVSRDRGRFVPSSLAPHVLATVHPSSILRAADEAGRQAAFEQFVDDLRVAAGALAGDEPTASRRATTHR
jgi:uracil-DNA glycosylase family protein